MNDTIDAEQIKRETMVTAVELFVELDSTNDYALARATDLTCLKPLLILAERQTAGRGRGNNRWWASEGALTFSLLMPNLRSASSALISLAVGVAVCDAVRSLSDEFSAQLKWPNDIYLFNHKLGGILIERLSHQSDALVIGIGLNVNNTIRHAPSEIQQAATALIDSAAAPLDMQQVLIELLRHVDHTWQAMTSDPSWLARRWRDLCLLSGRRVVIDVGQDQPAGICRGIADDGALMIETPTGLQRFMSGQVQFFE